jgi:hypothetical protein
LTFGDAAEKVRDGESGRSRVAITDLGKVPAERQHPKPVYCRCRPQAVHHRSEMQTLAGIGSSEQATEFLAETLREACP